MAIAFEYPDGATPLDGDHQGQLIPEHITTQAELNEWELSNVIAGQQWALARNHRDLLSIEFMQELHKRMFGSTWRWAGQLRRVETRPGVAPETIRVELMNLILDVSEQLRHAHSIEQVAARFHHRLVWIHPFPNGNGRFSRTMTDLLLRQNGAPEFSWGQDDLVAQNDTRTRYINALRAADARDYGALHEFVRSKKQQ